MYNTEAVGASKTFFDKMLNHVDHCFDDKKTGIMAANIGEVVLAFTNTISAAEFKELSDRAKSFNSELVCTVYDIKTCRCTITVFRVYPSSMSG